MKFSFSSKEREKIRNFEYLSLQQEGAYDDFNVSSIITDDKGFNTEHKVVAQKAGNVSKAIPKAIDGPFNKSDKATEIRRKSEKFKIERKKGR